MEMMYIIRMSAIDRSLMIDFLGQRSKRLIKEGNLFSGNLVANLTICQSVTIKSNSQVNSEPLDGSESLPNRCRGDSQQWSYTFWGPGSMIL